MEKSFGFVFVLQGLSQSSKRNEINLCPGNGKIDDRPTYIPIFKKLCGNPEHFVEGKACNQNFDHWLNQDERGAEKQSQNLGRKKSCYSKCQNRFPPPKSKSPLRTKGPIRPELHFWGAISHFWSNPVITGSGCWTNGWALKRIDMTSLQLVPTLVRSA